ncbi:helix-turn-helix transcriptional regulator [Motiliproteus sp. MSK22-1]|uniref:helix-turn-helix transcriptional regulator n=1 Tax=Motiliproteus sp. MSK22-1 TaxID=1897630 RepID=UPI0013018DA2|nr:AraC family transcriptional regulator [Motiliproteus sp. MSK22-1]
MDRLREVLMPEGLQLVQYRKGKEQVFYENDQLHTFSLYLKGGFETYRTDIQAPKGGPGRFCTMPEDSYSAWEVGSEQQFLHLYFDDGFLKRLALKTFDIDPRLLSLPQLTFVKEGFVDDLIRQGLLALDWHLPENNLALEQICQNLLVGLIEHSCSYKSKSSPLTSGLSPIVRKRVVEFVETHYSRQIKLSELAGLSGMSEYHFCRMFKVSMAETPQQFITRVRIERARQLIAEGAGCRIGQPPVGLLAEVSQACGYSNQSHFGRFFKKQMGVTPGQYLRSCQP